MCGICVVGCTHKRVKTKFKVTKQKTGLINSSPCSCFSILMRNAEDQYVAEKPTGIYVSRSKIIIEGDKNEGFNEQNSTYLLIDIITFLVRTPCHATCNNRFVYLMELKCIRPSNLLLMHDHAKPQLNLLSSRLNTGNVSN